MTPQHVTTESIIEHLRDLTSYPNQELPPYEEFSVGNRTYYFSPGGSLYQRDPETKEVGTNVGFD